MFGVKEAKTSMKETICSAIDCRQVINFYYRAGIRSVEPFCLGVIMPGDNELLLCYQVSGYSEFGGVVGWKLFRFSEIYNLEITSEHFTGIRPGYNPDDLFMTTIYCHVSTNMYDDIEPKKSQEPFTQPSDVSMIKLGTNTDADVEPKKSRKLFTSSYIRMIKLARKLNHNKKISGDIYFHPTERRIVVKSIDLSLPNPFCEVNRRPGARSSEKNRQYWEERWIEAYLINQAKNNDWKLKLQKNEYRFLLSQLKFRRDISKGERQGKILDLLLYNDEKQYLLVLELKSQANASVLNTAKSELGDYVTKLKEVIKTGDIAEAFGLKKEIKGIFVYLVWPKTDAEYNLGKYGLIEFDSIENPWERYKESGEDLEIRLTSEKGAFNLL